MTLAFAKSCYGLHKGFFVLYLSLNHIRRPSKQNLAPSLIKA